MLAGLGVTAVASAVVEAVLRADAEKHMLNVDIRNMFNAISRQQLRKLVAKDFPELESFADLLYADFGTTSVKADNSS